MNTFKKFGEASLLYAEYATVVDAVYEEFEKDIGRFLDCLRDEIKQIVKPLKLQEYVTPGDVRYWWIAPDSNSKNRDAYPQLAFYSDPTIDLAIMILKI